MAEILQLWIYRPGICRVIRLGDIGEWQRRWKLLYYVGSTASTA